jgi:hypothetical protein
VKTVKSWIFFHCLLRRYLNVRTVPCEGLVHCPENNGTFAAVSKHHIIKTTRQVKTTLYFLLLMFR